MEYFAISNGIPVHILDTKKGEKTILLLHGYSKIFAYTCYFSMILRGFAAKILKGKRKNKSSVPKKD